LIRHARRIQDSLSHRFGGAIEPRLRQQIFDIAVTGSDPTYVFQTLKPIPKRQCWSKTMDRSIPASFRERGLPRAHWLTVEWLPKYSLELNDIEIV
jgi:hypothetical protein